MRALAVLLILGLAACGERLSASQYGDQGFEDNLSDPGENAVEDAVGKLPWKHVAWKHKFNNRRITRMTLGGDQIFLETPENVVIAVDRFSGVTSWMYRIDTDTPLDWPPVVATGVPEEIRQLEADLVSMSRQVDDKMKEFGPGKETQALQKKRNEIRERIRVAAFGDNVYFISRQVLYCVDRLKGGLRWTHRLNFIPSAQPYAIRNYVFVPGADLARVWALDVERKGAEITFYKAEIFHRENQILNRAVYSDPALYFVCHDGNVYCYKVTDGNLTWKYQTERELKADPTVFVYRFDASDTPSAAPAEAPKPGEMMPKPGMEAPKAGMEAPKMGAGAMGAPAAGDDKGGKRKAQTVVRMLFVGGMDNAFYALDADAGSLIWKYECGTPMKTGAVAKDQTVYVKTVEGALHAFEIWPVHRDPRTKANLGSKRNGNLRWKVPLAERFVFKGKETVYIMGPKSEVWAMNEMTGEVVGRYPTENLQYILTNAADEYMYVANSAGYVFCLKESRQNY
ncbi:MAG TPA: PQQ-binding-like beta-propeller repeat protein [Planctomycetota bacterium]|nr:PQQ-binding-like beta-propeller repeat protein [Planctomycetota bacterium]